jgi:hypothetical protein
VRQAGLEQWPFVEQGLKTILRRCGPDNWTPEDVKRHIQTGLAGLFICDAGFFVLERNEEAITKKPYLNVWLAWFKPGYGRKHRTELIAWLDAMTKHTYCEWWQFSSPREGWIGIEPDCKKHVTTWRRKP